MYENIKGISIIGGMFSNSTKLPLYSKSSQRMCLIYGKNGSGKSTLSRAFLNCSDKNNISGLSASLYDFSDNNISLIQQQKDNIYVFNEDYVEKNIRIQQKGLNAIVLFGEHGELEEKINEEMITLEKINKSYDAQDLTCKKYDGDSQVTAPNYHMRQIRSLLQGDDAWAGLDSKIRKNKRNSSVTEEVIYDIVGLKPTHTLETLKLEFKTQFEHYNKISNGASKIYKEVKSINLYFDEQYILDLLSEKINQPELSKREEHILSMVIDGRQNFFDEVKETFSNPHVNTCPYCLQRVSDDYKSELISSIKKVLNKEVDEHIEKLRKSKINKVIYDLSEFEELEKEQVLQCKKVFDEYNAIIEKYNLLLEQKEHNVYTPIIIDSLKLDDKVKNINYELSILEKLRVKHNVSLDKVNEIANLLIKLNKEIAYYAIEEHYNQYSQLIVKQKLEKEKLDIILLDIKKKESLIESLIQQKKSIQIAVDYINKGLQYVFFSKDRLTLKLEEDSYVLFSNGRAVKPSDISCGERNIIGLCYYFTQIMNDMNEDDMYTQESFLVIDDPISSFDSENRIGILSFLKSQLLKIALGNENSRVVILSHDLSSIYDMEKAFSEIKDTALGKFNKKTTEYWLTELCDKTIIDFQYNKRNEYTALLEIVYQYASGNILNNELIIGNVMRRVLEAFSTFEYKKGIEKISCDKSILDKMGNLKYSEYFENLMYRLVLNGESHSEERVKSLHDINFFSTISETEKRRTAKDILCLIKLLNPYHIQAHLGCIQDSISNIDNWCKDILN